MTNDWTELALKDLSGKTWPEITAAFKRLAEATKSQYETENLSVPSIEPAVKDAHYTLFFDGACFPNPGNGGWGWVLLGPEGKAIERDCGGVRGNETNNTMEYRALIEGLKRVVAKKVQSISIRGDSQLVVNQVTGSWKTKQEHLQPMQREAATLLKSIPKATLSWIPREQNDDADVLSKRGLDSL